MDRRDGEGGNKVFFQDSITGRSLLNGLSGTFLIWTVVCPAQILVRAFHLPPGGGHKGESGDRASFCDLGLMDQKDPD